MKTTNGKIEYRLVSDSNGQAVVFRYTLESGYPSKWMMATARVDVPDELRYDKEVVSHMSWPVIDKSAGY